MSDLKTNLIAIKNEKDTKIIPENIKKDVTIFDVVGTYEGSGGGSGEVKKFATKQAMNSSSGNNNGDLAVVYGDALGHWEENTQSSIISFPSSVILDTPISSGDGAYGMLEPVDSGSYFYGNLDLSSSYFQLNIESSTMYTTISYTSSDGITYTRTDSGDETIDIGQDVYLQLYSEWIDAIGYFMTIPSANFEGIYKYNDSIFETDKIYPDLLSEANLTITDNRITAVTFTKNISPKYITWKDYTDIVKQFAQDQSITNYRYTYLFIGTDNKFHFIVDTSSYHFQLHTFNTNGEFLGMAYDYLNSTSIGSNPVYICTINDDKTYTLDNTLNDGDFTTIYTQNNGSRMLIPHNILNNKSVLVGFDPVYDNPGSGHSAICHLGSYTSISWTNNIQLYADTEYRAKLAAYQPAPSQINLKNANQLLTNVTGLGKEGSITGDGSIYNNLDAVTLIKNKFNLTSSYIKDDYSKNEYFGNIPTKYISEFDSNNKASQVFYKITDNTVKDKTYLGKITNAITPYCKRLENYTKMGLNTYDSKHNYIISLQAQYNSSTSSYSNYSVIVEDYDTHELINTTVLSEYVNYSGYTKFYCSNGNLYMFLISSSKKVLTVKKLNLDTFTTTTVDTINMNYSVSYNRCNVYAYGDYIIYGFGVQYSSTCRCTIKILKTTTDEITILRNNEYVNNASSSYLTSGIMTAGFGDECIYVFSNLSGSSTYSNKLYKYNKSTKQVTTLWTNTSTSIGYLMNPNFAAFEDTNFVHLYARVYAKSEAKCYYTKAHILDENDQEIKLIDQSSYLFKKGNQVYLSTLEGIYKVDSYTTQINNAVVHLYCKCSELYRLPGGEVSWYFKDTTVNSIQYATLLPNPDTLKVNDDNTYEIVYSTKQYETSSSNTSFPINDVSVKFTNCIESTSLDYTYSATQCLYDTFIQLNPDKSNVLLNYEDIGTISPAEATQAQEQISNLFGEEE